MEQYSKDPASSCLNENDINRLAAKGESASKTGSADEGARPSATSILRKAGGNLLVSITGDPASNVVVSLEKSSKIEKDSKEPDVSDIVKKCEKSALPSEESDHSANKLLQDMNSIPGDPASASGGTNTDPPGDEQERVIGPPKELEPPKP